MVKVKICGITNFEDAQAASAAGADMLGFVFYEKSPRYIKPAKAMEIIQALPKHIEKAALFVNEDKETVMAVLDEVKGIDILQFHGDETPQYCNSFNKRIIRAIRVKNKDSIKQMADYKVNFFLLDAFKQGIYGGTGENFNWSLAKEAKVYDTPIILSGGLTPGNVKEAIETAKPYMVDVSSGVEIAPGKKGPELIRKFIQQAKEQ
jgi:phosphoribosylanthranilate isomerase